MKGCDCECEKWKTEVEPELYKFLPFCGAELTEVKDDTGLWKDS